MGKQLKKNIKIYQKNISINYGWMNNHMILIFIDGERVIDSCVIPYPDWFKFYDPDFEYYQPCRN
jgi:hypothetical protein